MLTVLGFFLFWVSFSAMLMLSAMLGIAVFFYIYFVRPRVCRAGENVAVTNEQIIRGVNQGIGGIKEIRVLRVEKFFLDAVSRSADFHSEAQLSFNSLLVIPRYLMETVVGLFVILFSIVVVFQNDGDAHLIGILAMFGAAGIRILPAITQVSSALASMNYSAFSLTELYKDFKDIEAFGSTLVFSETHSLNIEPFRTLELTGIRYAYANTAQPAINDISIAIEKGQSIGLIGESGSGKTTVIDILLGLHRFDSGHFKVNGLDIEKYGWERWRNQIAYIPQSVFLIDDTLERNIAFGIPSDQIERDRVMMALEEAQLAPLFARLPMGLKTTLGERGIRLSGGERQRIALARAFYHNRSIFIFDEATSSLDLDTEKQVMEVIENLHGKKTLIVIAHRLSTLKGCDIIYRIRNGKSIEHGNYARMIGDKT